MADENQTYPIMPIKHWWTLRNKFKQSIPGTVTASYISTVLNMQEKSARASVLPSLVRLGIIDKDGKTGDRARRWRDDVDYPEVCKEILDDVYPIELLEAVSNPNEEQNVASRWFAKRAGVVGVGKSAANKMAALYAIISKADPADGDKAKATIKRKATPTKPAKYKVTKKAKAQTLPKEPPQPEPDSDGPRLPGININLEVHISSDATPDQIDKIFESMAKHIYQKQ